jgi:hypothetical protein
MHFATFLRVPLYFRTSSYTYSLHKKIHICKLIFSVRFPAHWLAKHVAKKTIKEFQCSAHRVHIGEEWK